VIRLGIIGLGAVTRNIHLPAYARLRDKITIVGACEINPSVRAAAEKTRVIPAVYDTAREMIESSRPDIVTICTPPSDHYGQCLKALDLGCHVFCEKPLVEDLNQVDELMKAMEQSGRYIVVNSQFPYMNIHMSAKQCIGTPDFGDLLFLHAWQTVNPLDHAEAGWRKTMKRPVGLEFGVHVFELVRFFFDAMPVKIFGHMPNPRPATSSETINMISMEFSDGRAASVLLNRVSRGPERYLEMRLDGDHGSIYTSIGGEVKFGAGVHTRKKRPFLYLSVTKGGKAIIYHAGKSKILAKDGTNPFASATAVHLRNFLTALETGRKPAGLIDDNRKTLALAFAAYDSARLGRMVDVSGYVN
jgi:predicted dehydrogenase